MMSIVKNAVIKLSGSAWAQRLLERNVSISQYLMGIGSGGAVSISGEAGVFRFLDHNLQPPYCIFDVGANRGQFLRLACTNIRDGEFLVHSFEPALETFKLLSSAFGADPRVKLNNFGLGKEKCSAILHFNDVASELASLTKRRLDHFNLHFSKSETVEISTVDDYCSENGIDRIHLLKIDIEGHELDALAGARRMLGANAVDVVTFEFGGCNIDTRTYFQDFWYFFDEFKMKIFRITPSGYLSPIDHYREALEQFRTANFVAVANAGRGR